MIAHSTGSRARRIAGTALATLLVGAGLGLTASGSIAAPSRIAPESVKPLFHPQTQAKLVMVADTDQGSATTATQAGGDTESDAAASAPIPPAAPLPPRDTMRPPVPPVEPRAPMPPVPPVPPVGMNGVLSDAQIEEIKHAGEAGREAAREAANQAIAATDFAKLSRDSMIQARTELARDCKHAKPAVAGEDDAQAIQRLAMGCVDMAAIGREVQASLKQAMDQVRADQHIAEADRARALAEIARARADMAKKFAQ